MKKRIQFNTNAYTARLIGRENVSTLNGAILELVKNAYDANANECILYYEDSTQFLYLMDNGDGMSEETILNNWMTIGNSSKYSTYVTEKGRIQTGAKGIGRFALDRIGDKCTMFTKTRKNKNTLEWGVNWSDFDRGLKLTDVEAVLDSTDKQLNSISNDFKNKEVINLFNNVFDGNGTIFRIDSLRDEWGTAQKESIKESLSSLLPPHMEEIFKIYFFEETTSLYDAAITSKGIEDYDYKILFKCNDNNVYIEIDRNEYDLGEDIDKIINNTDLTDEDRKYFSGEKIEIKKTISELTNENIALDIGDFSGELYFNKIAKSEKQGTKYYYKDITGRKNYADVFGGIKIYRDNFRVRPYGEIKSAGYDWLLLGVRHAKSPASVSHKSGKWRVIPQQICGIINISRININLPDQSNREGIVETRQFKGLKQILLSIIEIFEEDRQRIGRELKKYYELTHPTELITESINEKAELEEKNREKGITVTNESTLVSAREAKIVIDEKNKEIEDLETEIELLRNLATVGIASVQYIHETRDSVNRVGNSVGTGKDALKFKNDVNLAISKLEETQENISNMNSWFKVTLGSVRKDKRHRKKVDINSLFSEYVNKWKKVLETKRINLYLDAEEIGYFRCLPYEIESIITNLIVNSVHSLKYVETKEINISVKKISDGFSILYKDNGEGLSDKYKNNPKIILNAFETSKINENGEKIGTGMGMWIIDSIVKSYNGAINLNNNKTINKGFEIEIILNE